MIPRSEEEVCLVTLNRKMTRRSSSQEENTDHKEVTSTVREVGVEVLEEIILGSSDLTSPEKIKNLMASTEKDSEMPSGATVV